MGTVLYSMRSTVIKNGITIDLKDDSSKDLLHDLIKKADVMILNFRPGVAKHLGIDFDSVCKINPEIVYGDITGYGTSGPWKDLPGQDLLVQSLSGLAWLNGNANQPPMPFGLSIADMCAGQHLAQGILAGLIQSKTKKEPVYVQTNLLESILDLQFEVFTTYLNDGHQNPVRSTVNNANAYIDAPYGIYKTADGYIALAMVPIPYLGELIHCSELTKYTDPSLSDKRDEIKSILSKHLITKTTYSLVIFVRTCRYMVC